MRFIGIDNSFGESGEINQLYNAYGISEANISNQIRSLLKL